MKKLLFLFIIAFSVTLLSVTACAAAPGVQEGTSAVTVSNISDGDFAIAAVYDENRILEGVKIYKDQSEVSVNYSKDIFANYEDADYMKLFVWSQNQEPKMTAYGIDIKKYKDATDETDDKTISIQIGDNTITATLEDNSSAQAFYELLKDGPVTVDMTDYGNFEKVGPLPTSLPRNDEQITTEPGDIILYQGNSITIYYDTNTWSFTRLGKVNGLSQSELKAILGTGGITAVFSIASGTKPETTAPKTLVAYFSCTGTTETLANKIISVTDVDSFRIIPKEPYTSADLTYSNSSSRATVEQQQNTNTRPEIENQIENLGDYDTILIGYPIWWGKCPRIILTFLETYKNELSGKTIIPFCTSGSSGISGSLPEIRNALPDSSVKDGFRGTANMTEEQIKSQLEANDYDFN